MHSRERNKGPHLRLHHPPRLERLPTRRNGTFSPRLPLSSQTDSRKRQHSPRRRCCRNCTTHLPRRIRRHSRLKGTTRHRRVCAIPPHHPPYPRRQRRQRFLRPSRPTTLLSRNVPTNPRHASHPLLTFERVKVPKCGGARQGAGEAQEL